MKIGYTWYSIIIYILDIPVDRYTRASNPFLWAKYMDQLLVNWILEILYWLWSLRWYKHASFGIRDHPPSSSLPRPTRQTCRADDSNNWQEVLWGWKVSRCYTCQCWSSAKDIHSLATQSHVMRLIKLLVARLISTTLVGIGNKDKS